MAGCNSSPVLSQGQSWCSWSLAKLSEVVSLHPGQDSKPQPMPRPFLSPSTAPHMVGYCGAHGTLGAEMICDESSLLRSKESGMDNTRSGFSAARGQPH